MARAFSSEFELAFALTVSAGAIASSVLLLATLVVLRALRRARVWRLSRREGAWRDALNAATEDPGTARLEPIGRLDFPHFIALWNHFQASLKGEASARLGTLLALHGLDDRVLRLLERRALRLRLIAITALGHLREERAWSRLEEIALGPGAIASFAAASALLRIEPRRALDVLADSIAGREDWSLARIGTIFKELGPAVITAPLVTMLLKQPHRGLERVVKLARLGHRDRIGAIVRGWLESSTDPEVLVAALNFVEDRSDLPWARGAGRHQDWRVRMSAARAIGRIGGRGELAALLELLRDPVWWVRHHAAQALARLPGLEAAELDALRDNARDAFAADMLGQALAERDWA